MTLSLAPTFNLLFAENIGHFYKHDRILLERLPDVICIVFGLLHFLLCCKNCVSCESLEGADFVKNFNGEERHYNCVFV